MLAAIADPGVVDPLTAAEGTPTGRTDRAGGAAAPARRRPGRPNVLSEAEIVDAAMAIAHEQGIAKVSMRAVARLLGVPPMTVYGYVPNKDALDALVVDRILGEVRVPGPEVGPWDVRLQLMLVDARRILVERPHLGDGQPAAAGSPVELLHRGAFGREATRLVDAVLALLAEGGFAPEVLDVCFGALFTYVTGFAGPGEGPDGSGAAPADPGTTGATRTAAEVFALGLEALVEGLKVTMPRTGDHQR